ncbi:MAG: squalene/phytoene synthase family protein [Pseudomonadota bacterium]
MIATLLHDEDLQAVREITARDRSNLYLTSQFLRDEERYQAFLAMYAVMRVIDDAVDKVEDKQHLAPAQRADLHHSLEGWSARIQDAYRGAPADAPLDRALAWAVARFPVPLMLWQRFVEAMHFDVDHPRFDRFETFLDYAEGATVAPTTIYIYLLTCEAGDDGKHQVHRFDYQSCGRELGLFAYLAHVLRDVRNDALVGSTGLVYLSTADLASCDLVDRDLRRFAEARRSDGRFARAVQLLVERARAFEARGVALVEQVLPRLPPDRCFVLRLIVAYYQEMLQRVADPGLDLFAVEEVMGTSDKLAIAARVADAAGFRLDPETLLQAARPS